MNYQEMREYILSKEKLLEKLGIEGEFFGLSSDAEEVTLLVYSPKEQKLGATASTQSSPVKSVSRSPADKPTQEEQSEPTAEEKIKKEFHKGL